MHINPVHLIIAITIGVIAGYFYRSKGKVNFKVIILLSISMAVVVAMADWILI